MDDHKNIPLEMVDLNFPAYEFPTVKLGTYEDKSDKVDSCGSSTSSMCIVNFGDTTRQGEKDAAEVYNILPNNKFQNLYSGDQLPDTSLKQTSGDPRLENNSDLFDSITLKNELRLENVVDGWSCELKKNILTEYNQAKFCLKCTARKVIDEEKRRIQSTLKGQQDEISVLHISVDQLRKQLTDKSTVVKRLSMEIAKQRDKQQLWRRFSQWRLLREQKTREVSFDE